MVVFLITKNLNKMKHKLKLIIIPILFIFFACEEYEHEPISGDTNMPGVIENLVFIATPGGFDITYDLPSDKDLLYVKAVYTTTQGVEAEVKTSAFNNKIEILGLGDTNERTVKLYTVDRSANVSNPVSFVGAPLTPPVFLIEQTMEITSDFGGARFTWANELKTPISIDLLVENEEGELEIVKTQYTEQQASKVSLRGFESNPTLFAAVIRDRYDNFSDTIYASTPDKLLTPLFETRLDKTIFKKVILQNDDNWDAWEGDYWNFFDDDLESIVHTQGDHPRPSILTVDLGVNVELSRFNVQQRAPNSTHFAYTHGNPKTYTVYGSKELPGQDGNLDDWILLRECESIKPSGLPIGQNTDEDIDHFLAGDEFSFEAPIEIRYFRFVVHETWDGAGYINISEMTFWGNIVEQ